MENFTDSPTDSKSNGLAVAGMVVGIVSIVFEELEELDSINY